MLNQTSQNQISWLIGGYEKQVFQWSEPSSITSLNQMTLNQVFRKNFWQSNWNCFLSSPSYLSKFIQTYQCSIVPNTVKALRPIASSAFAAHRACVIILLLNSFFVRRGKCRKPQTVVTGMKNAFYFCRMWTFAPPTHTPQFVRTYFAHIKHF